MAKTFILTQNHLMPSGFLAELGRELRAGKLAAFPTDTVYGLGTWAESERGVEMIYRLKGRSPLKPLPFLVESPMMAWRYAEVTPRALKLAEKYWPGPLTMVLWPTPEGKRFLHGHPTIGLRVPKHKALLEILRELRGPLASTSANLSGEPAGSQPSVLGPLESAVDYVILEDEPLPGLESTVVDLTEDEPRILREGAIPGETIVKLLETAGSPPA